MRATPANGYRFAGWYLSASAAGDPAWADAEATVRVTARRTIYAKFAKDAHSVCEWEGSETPKALVWRSKTYESSKPFNPSACRVDALGYAGDGRGTLLELEVDMFSAPDAAPTATARLANIADQNARRLPVRRMERYMQVEVKANVKVDALLVGTSMGGGARAVKKVVQRPLPHAVPFEDVADPSVRRKVMLMVENEKALAAQLAEAQRASS